MIPDLSALPKAVRVVEVGPRDGLQNEKVQIPTEQKIQFIQLLAESGLPTVEATSFLSPKAIPQLSDASVVMAGLQRLPQLAALDVPYCDGCIVAGKGMVRSG